MPFSFFHFNGNRHKRSDRHFTFNGFIWWSISSLEPIMYTRQKQCEFCGRFFIPDRRVGTRQRSCSRTECRKKRKAAAQALWVSQNPDCFKGRSANTKRWRYDHPGYQRQRRKKNREIQDAISASPPMKSVRLLLPVQWFKNEIQDAKVVLTLLDSDTYAYTGTG